MKDKQTLLVPKAKKTRTNMLGGVSDRQKKELRSWWKKYKVGLIAWDKIPVKFQKLLKKYYPIE